MRIHTDVLTREDLHCGVPAGVSLHILSEHGSRSHARAFEAALRGHAVRHTRAPNTGLFGAAQGDERAATYDDWGWWLAELFERDPDAKTSDYRDRDHFHQSTDCKYAPRHA